MEGEKKYPHMCGGVLASILLSHKKDKSPQGVADPLNKSNFIRDLARIVKPGFDYSSDSNPEPIVSYYVNCRRKTSSVVPFAKDAYIEAFRRQMEESYPLLLYPLLGHFHPYLSKERKNHYPDVILTAEGLVSYARRCLDIPTVYIWGAKGEKVTESFLKCCRRDFPDVFDDRKIRELKPFCGIGYRAFDCCGLLKCYTMGGLEHLRFNQEMDLNAAALFAASTHKGGIETLPETPGICLYMEGHTGLYEGNGSVIECTSNPKFGNGVVRTKLPDRPWTHWYEMPWVDYNMKG